jgi:hypothetical protein
MNLEYANLLQIVGTVAESAQSMNRIYFEAENKTGSITLQMQRINSKQQPQRKTTLHTRNSL